ncbi:24289_t:CDS:1, partial [Entrophospora sp. SA101]
DYHGMTQQEVNELMETDLARMKNEPVYRAMLTSSIAKTPVQFNKCYTN